MISIITPVYNEEDYLGYNLESVKNQTYNKIEHIVVNDGSTDSTQAILEQYQDEYNLKIFTQQNKGQATAINKAFRNVNGDYVFWLNADDVIFRRDTIEKVVRTFKNRENADILYGNRAIINSDNKLVRININNPVFNKKRLLRSCFAAFNYYRSEIVENHKLDSSYSLTLDYEYFLRLANEGYNFSYLNNILYCYRTHENAKSVDNRDMQRTEGKEIRKKYKRKLNISDISPNAFDILINYYINIYKLIFILTYSHNEYNVAFPANFDSRKELLIRSF